MLEKPSLGGLLLAFLTSLLCMVSLVQHFLQDFWCFHKQVDLQKADLLHSGTSQDLHRRGAPIRLQRNSFSLQHFQTPLSPDVTTKVRVQAHDFCAFAASGKELSTMTVGAIGF